MIPWVGGRYGGIRWASHILWTFENGGVAFVDEGNSHREAARHFRVSPRFVNDMIKLRRETGGLGAKRQGNPGRGKLTEVAPWVRDRIAAQGDLTFDALVRELRAAHGIDVHRSAVGRLLHRLGLTHRKRAARG